MTHYWSTVSNWACLSCCRNLKNFAEITYAPEHLDGLRRAAFCTVSLLQIQFPLFYRLSAGGFWREAIFNSWVALTRSNYATAASPTRWLWRVSEIFTTHLKWMGYFIRLCYLFTANIWKGKLRRDSLGWSPVCSSESHTLVVHDGKCEESPPRFHFSSWFCIHKRRNWCSSSGSSNPQCAEKQLFLCTTTENVWEQKVKVFPHGHMERRGYPRAQPYHQI